MPLEEYRKKRSFEKTPEPAGEIAESGNRRFVVQKHAATRLHYDFRLEIGGVLKSWAIPRGPSMNPAEKRLAVAVEDHPVDYIDFEGTIPEGQYGAGTVIVWDRGEFEAEDEPQASLEKGHLGFVLRGKKLAGAFDLIKMVRKGGNNWLLIKRRDEFANPTGNVLDEEKSVESGLTLKEIEGEAAQKKPETAQMRRFVPMLPTLIRAPFSDPDWLYELKWDGVRSICFLQNGELKLISRNLQDFSNQYPEIVNAANVIKAKTAIFDGEIVAPEKSGKPSFQKLQRRIGLQNPSEIKSLAIKEPVTLLVFDLLNLEGTDLTFKSLIDRKKMLDSIVTENPRIIISEYIVGRGELFFETAKSKGLEGIIAKKISSRYSEGRSRDWLKIKLQKTQDCIVGGFTEPRGGRKRFGSLLLGIFERGKIEYAGHVGGGFSDESIEKVYDLISPLETAECPFSGTPKINQRAHWVEPRLVCEVKFSEWTSDGRLRQPVFLGMRTDKDPEGCIKEIPSPAALVKQKRSTGTEVSVKVGDHPLKITNPDKIFWPSDGIRKIDLVNYYRKMAKHLVPHLTDRPIVMKRYPDGIEGDFFFMKDAGGQVPEWIETAHLYSESTGEYIDYVICNDEETLIYLSNLACIDQNHVLSRVGNLSSPDFVLFDLDPFEPAGFRETVRVAHSIRDLLERLELESFVKTSGATGIHILVPLENAYSFEQVRNFAHLVALVIARDNERLITFEREVAKRKGVYIDFEQNVQGKSIASVYSVRPLKGAPVSTPLGWDELTEFIDPLAYNIFNVPERVEKPRDIFKPVLELKQNLKHPLELLEKQVEGSR